MRRKALMITLGVLVLFAFTASLALAQTGDPVSGKDLWAQNNCKSCHGANGEGAYAGPRAGDGRTAAQWIAQVRQPRNQMPAYRPDQVSDQAIADMQAYMQTLPKPESFTPTVAATTADDPPGKQLMAQKRCVSCHAGFGEGLVQAAFTAQNRQVTYDAVLKQVRDPLRRMPIFGQSKLSDDEVRQIADFLASYQTQATPTTGAATPPAGAAPPPTTLPTTGGAGPPIWAGPLVAVLVIAGSFLLRRRVG